MLKQEAHHDSLTGLPNRRKFDEILPFAIERAKSQHSCLAVLFLDLDGFKLVNDSHGHHVGDMLLKGVSKRINKYIRQTDTVARYSGDEFLIILEGVYKEKLYLAIAEKILASISEPFDLEGIQVKITASMGLVNINDELLHKSSPLEIIQCADKAMYQAKKDGKNAVYTFTHDDKSRGDTALRS